MATYDTAIAGGGGTHLVRLTVTSRFQCQNRDSVYLTFKNCTGMEDNNTFSFQVYPNPGNGMFMVGINNAEPGPLRMEIKNSVSEIVYYENDPFISGNRNKKINLTFLPDGVYLLSLTTAHGTSVHKLIICK